MRKASSPLILHPSSLIPHPSSLILHPSSFIPHPSSLIPAPPSHRASSVSLLPCRLKFEVPAAFRLEVTSRFFVSCCMPQKPSLDALPLTDRCGGLCDTQRSTCPHP